jgi:hypothetical protein
VSFAWQARLLPRGHPELRHATRESSGGEIRACASVASPGFQTVAYSHGMCSCRFRDQTMYRQVCGLARSVVGPASASVWRATGCLPPSSVHCCWTPLATDAPGIREPAAPDCSPVAPAAAEPGGLVGLVVATGVAADVVAPVACTGTVAESGWLVRTGSGMCPSTESLGRTESLKSSPSWWEGDIGSRQEEEVAVEVLAFHVRLTIHIQALHLSAILSLIPLALRLLPAQAPFQGAVALPAVSLSAGATAAACGSQMASGQMANPGERVIVHGSPTRLENWKARICDLGVQPGCGPQ